ncbi:MAG: L,D-transpeptidase [Verrucomicrobiota bacterium]|nr:L,D-transpeptidase [Verrucomicrobiota bacterium]
MIRLFNILCAALLTLSSVTAADKTPPVKVSLIVVSLKDQAFVAYANDKPVLVGPISSGRESNATPTGNFSIANKHKDWISTIYDVPMPHFLRFNTGSMGMHAGILPGFPASHGCIRLTPADAEKLFSITSIGVKVKIVDSTTLLTAGVKQPPFVPQYYRVVDGKKMMLSQRENLSAHNRRINNQKPGYGTSSKR